MENNEIMDRLLQEDKPASDIKDDVLLAKQDGESSITKIRRVTAKYKLYIIILFIFIILFLIFWIPNANDKLKSSKSAYDTANQQRANLERDIKDAEDDMAYLCDDTNGVVRNEEAIKLCLNKKSNCAKLPDQWKTGSGNSLEDYDIKVPLSYLQLQSLYNRKMPVDEKRVLKNLNEYLIKQDISGGERDRVGEILRINIGDPESVGSEGSHFFKVPVDIQVEFETVQDLIEFLYNVEKKIVNNVEDRILYKIQAVSYDVVANDEPQITDISMIAYYYYDEKFKGVVECVGIENQDVKEAQSDPEDEDSDSVFDKIFSNFQ